MNLPRRAIILLAQGCEGRCAAVGQQGKEADRVQQARRQALVPLLAAILSPRVQVHRHPVPVHSYTEAAAQRQYASDRRASRSLPHELWAEY